MLICSAEAANLSTQLLNSSFLLLCGNNSQVFHSLIFSAHFSLNVTRHSFLYLFHYNSSWAPNLSILIGSLLFLNIMSSLDNQSPDFPKSLFFIIKSSLPASVHIRIIVASIKTNSQQLPQTGIHLKNTKCLTQSVYGKVKNQGWETRTKRGWQQKIQPRTSAGTIWQECCQNLGKSCHRKSLGRMLPVTLPPPDILFPSVIDITTISVNNLLDPVRLHPPFWIQCQNTPKQTSVIR